VTQPAPSATTTALIASSTQLTTQQNLLLTTTVNSATGIPTGTVTLSDSGTVLASVSLGNGVATFNDASLVDGTHTIVAVYGGDATHAASTSVAVAVTVTQPVAPPALTSTKTTLSASATQLATGQSLILTATGRSGIASQQPRLNPRSTSAQFSTHRYGPSVRIYSGSKTTWPSLPIT
jgi:hypothetical protein